MTSLLKYDYSYDNVAYGILMYRSIKSSIATLQELLPYENTLRYIAGYNLQYDFDCEHYMSNVY